MSMGMAAIPTLSPQARLGMGGQPAMGGTMPGAAAPVGGYGMAPQYGGDRFHMAYSPHGDASLFRTTAKERGFWLSAISLLFALPCVGKRVVGCF